MSGTTSVPSATFGDAGFVAPAELDILTGVQADLNAAFGGGMDQALETPQGQLASSLTAIVADKNDQFLALTHGVDPAFASGRMQDAIGRIYFIERYPAVSTIVNALCTGVINAQIPSRSLAKATDGNLYSCVDGGFIGADGTITLQFACTVTGPITCPATTLDTIYRGVPGWDTITNVSDGIVGNDVEGRSAFELRRQQSVYKNAVGSIPAIQASVLDVPNILDAYTTDNTTGFALVQDGVTIPSGAIYVCAAGGDPLAIAAAIWKKKPPGCRMSGNTTLTVLDSNSGYSLPYPSYNITFQTAAEQSFVFTVSIASSPLVPSTAITLIRAAVLSSFAGLDGGPRARISSSVYASRFYTAIAKLGTWAEIVSVKIGSTGLPKATFAASIAGTVMTVSAISQGVIGVGHTVVGPGVADNVTIVSNNTGSGGTGSYNISIPQTISSQQLVAIFADLDVATVGIAHIPVLAEPDIRILLV